MPFLGKKSSREQTLVHVQRRFAKHALHAFPEPSPAYTPSSVPYSALIHFLPGFATPPGSQLHSIPKNNLCIFEIYPGVPRCVLRARWQNVHRRARYLLLLHSRRPALCSREPYAEIGLERCRKSRIDALWIFISCRRTPRRRDGIRSLKVTGERKAENRLFLPVLTGEIFKRPSLILPPWCLERHPYSALRASLALLEPFPRIDHRYCPRKITISSRARGSIGHGRRTPARILRILALQQKSPLMFHFSLLFTLP